MERGDRDGPPDERAATAYHEAGHAVWRVHHGLVLRHVSLVPDDAAGTSGHVLGGSGDLARRFEAGAWGARDRERAHQEIMDCFAGYLAEARALGRPVDPRTWRGDARQAALLAVALSADDETEARLLLRWLRYRAQRGVGQPRVWAAIEAVAAALLAHRTLSGPNVRRLYRQAMASAERGDATRPAGVRPVGPTGA